MVQSTLVITNHAYSLSMKMASVETKRPHVLTKRMQEYLCTKRIASDAEGGTTRLFRCPRAGCNKVLTSTPGLRYHIKTHDSQIGAYVCTRCHKRFRSYNGLRYHRQQTICEVQVSVRDYGYHALEASQFYHHPRIKDTGDYSEYYPGEPSFSPPHVGDCMNQADAIGMRPRSWSESDTSYVSSESDHAVDEEHNWLRELAIIATGPRSPLIQQQDQRMPCTLRDSMHTYAHPPRSRSVSPTHVPGHQCYTSSTLTDTMKCESSELTHQVGSTDTGGEYASCGIFTEWLCFMKGTRFKFDRSTDSSWHEVEDIATLLGPEKRSYGEEGLQLTSIESSEDQGHAELAFSAGQSEEPSLRVKCTCDHPFYVKDKGWCSLQPAACQEAHGVKCLCLSVGDLCLPPNHPLTLLSKDAMDSLKSLDFTAMDSSAVLTLSNMAKQKKEQTLSPQKLHLPYRIPACIKSPTKAKRPMNAFMIFAKRFRLEYMHQHPGKDNRAISVLLGDRWKKLASEERREYLQEAKHLADEQKRRHPDCWKRKRTMSTGSMDSSS